MQLLTAGHVRDAVLTRTLNVSVRVWRRCNGDSRGQSLCTWKLKKGWRWKEKDGVITRRSFRTWTYSYRRNFKKKKCFVYLPSSAIMFFFFFSNVKEVEIDQFFVFVLPHSAHLFFFNFFTIFTTFQTKFSFFFNYFLCARLRCRNVPVSFYP